MSEASPQPRHAGPPQHAQAIRHGHHEEDSEQPAQTQFDDDEQGSEDDSEDNSDVYMYGSVYDYRPQPHRVLPRAEVDQRDGAPFPQRMPLGQASGLSGLKQASGASRIPLSTMPSIPSPAMNEDQPIGTVVAEKKNEKTLAPDMTHCSKSDHTMTGSAPSRKLQHSAQPREMHHHWLPASTSVQLRGPHNDVYEQTVDESQRDRSHRLGGKLYHPSEANVTASQSTAGRHPHDDGETQPQQDMHAPAGAETSHDHENPHFSEPDEPEPGIDFALTHIYQQFHLDKKRQIEHGKEELRWRSQIEQEKTVQQSLRSQIDTLLREKEEVSAAVNHQKAKVANFEAKASKLKSFVNGLGKDMDSLKQKANANREESEQVAENERERKAELERLHGELSTGVEESTRLMHEANKLCREAHAELTAAKLRSAHLEEQLEAKSRQLIEEKDLREQIQSQLTSAAAAQEATDREITSSRDAVLGKLVEMGTVLDNSSNRAELTEMLDKTFQAVQGINSQQSTSLDDVQSVKGAVESLSEALSALPQRSSLDTDQVQSLKTYFDNAIASIKSDISSQREAAIQQVSDKKTIDHLQAEIRSHDARILEFTSQLTNAREANTELINQKAILQEKVTKLESDIAASARDHEQLGDLREKLAAKDSELSTTISKADLQTKELSNITASNADLHKQLEALEQRLREIPLTSDFDDEREELERKRVKDVEDARQEISEQATTFHALQQSKAENIQKALRSECEKLRGEVQRLKSELTSACKRVESLEQAQNAQLGVPKLLADSQKEVKEIRSKVASLEQANKSKTVTAKELESLQAQLSASQNSMLEISREKDALKEEITGLHRLSQEAKSSEEKIKKQLQQEQVANRNAKEALDVELQTVKDAKIRDVKLAQEAKQAAIEEEQTRHQSEMELIQQRLQDSEDTLKKATEAAENAHADEQEKHEKRVAEINDKVMQVERERDEALANLETVQNELANVRAAMHPVQSGGQGDASVKATDTGAPKKRRALDRNHARSTATKEPAYALHKSPTHPAGAMARGPVVQESQQDYIPQSSYPQSSIPDGDIEALFAHAGNLSPNRQVPNPSGRELGPSRGPVVEESQQPSDGSPSSFRRGAVVEESQQLDSQSQTLHEAQKNSVRETQQHPDSFMADTIERYAPDDSFQDLFFGLIDPSQEDTRDLYHDENTQSVPNTQQSSNADLPFAGFRAKQQSQRVPQSPVFREQVQRRSSPMGQPSGGFARSSLHEPENRVTKKIMPPPNSSSKRMRPNTGDSSRSGGSHRPSHNTHKTPEPKGSSRNGSVSINGKRGPPSSSPEFINSQKDVHTTATYSERVGHRQSGKERSKSSLKRKASSQGVSGYEQEKKRRTSVATKTGDSSQPGPRVSSQMMATDRPSSQASRSRTNVASSMGDRTPAQSRMRGLGGSVQSSTRQTRSKKLSRNADMSAAFSQELR